MAHLMKQVDDRKRLVGAWGDGRMGMEAMMEKKGKSWRPAESSSEFRERCACGRFMRAAV